MADPLSDQDIARLFSPFEGERSLALAVSGGPDSMALLYCAAKFQELTGWPGDLLVLTVNHGLRPEAADEARLAETAAARFGIRAEIIKVSIDRPSSNTQMKAREARYQAMTGYLEDSGFKGVLLTAHHLDDQAETFLLRLSRGSGVYGLAAIRPQSGLRNGVPIARPFLDVPKESLTETLKAAGVPFAEDPSNQDSRFDRVRMRKALTHLEKAGLTSQRIGLSAANLRRAADALDHYVKQHLLSCALIAPGGAFRIEEEAFRDAPEEIRLRGLAGLLRMASGSAYTAELEKLLALLRALDSDSSIPFRRVLSGATVHRTRGGVWIYREAGRKGLPEITVRPGETALWDGRLTVSLARSAKGPVSVSALGEHHSSFAFDGNLPGTLKRAVPAVMSGDDLYVFDEEARPTAPDGSAFSPPGMINAAFCDAEFRSLYPELGKVKQKQAGFA